MCPPETPGQTPLDTPADLSRTIGSLAHDVNNLLTAILGYANMVARTFDDRDPRRSDVDEIIRAAQRAGVLSHEMLVLAGRPARPRSAPSGAPDSTVATGRVLVVEDESAVRFMVRTVLTRAGYDVFEAPNLETAEAWLVEHAATLHLLITDIVLPHGNGQDLYQRALVRCPSLRVVYMSGYPAETVHRDQLLEPATPFLEKPFTGEELSRKVREVLGGGQGT